MIRSLAQRFRRRPAEALAQTSAVAAAPMVDTEDNEDQYKPIDWALVRRLLQWLAPYRWSYVLGLVLAAGHVLLEMAAPRFMQHIIDFVTGYAAGTPVAP